MGTPSAATKLHERAQTVLHTWSATEVIYVLVCEPVLTATANHLNGGPWPTLTMESP